MTMTRSKAGSRLPQFTPTRIVIEMELDTCANQAGSNSYGDGQGCPFCTSERTPYAGFAFDYYCNKFSPRRKVMGYVEGFSDHEPVPSWCPLRKKEGDA